MSVFLIATTLDLTLTRLRPRYDTVDMALVFDQQETLTLLCWPNAVPLSAMLTRH